MKRSGQNIHRKGARTSRADYCLPLAVRKAPLIPLAVFLALILPGMVMLMLHGSRFSGESETVSVSVESGGGHINTAPGTTHLISVTSSAAFKSTANPGSAGNTGSSSGLYLFSDAPEAHVSPSGLFVIRYHTAGTHAVYPEDSSGSGIPDFVERAAEYADSSWNYLVGYLGFADPVYPENSPYEIILEKRGESIFGETVVNAGGQTTRTYVHPTFDGFPGNSDPEGNRYGSLKVTVAHELKHASQFAGTGWQGDAGNIHWMELDAIMAENLVFPDVKDYYRHLNSVNSIFRDPKISVPEYPWHITWMIYWAERMGPEFMAGVWDRLATGETMIQAVRNGLQTSGRSWREEVTRNYLWHLASGAYASGTEGFSDRFDYPTPVPSPLTGLLTRVDGAQFNYRPLSAGFHKIVPAESDTGDVILFVMAADSLAGVGVYAYRETGPLADTGSGADQWTSGGSALSMPGYAVGGQLKGPAGFTGADEPGAGSKLVYTPDPFGRLLYNTGLRWEEIDTLGLVTVNTAVSGNRRFHILAGNGNSIERLRYGDATLNGATNQADVSLILMSLTGASAPLAGFQRFTADVSGNGRVSALDASLILQKLAGFTDRYPADLNGNGFGPEYELITAGSTSPFAGLRGNSGEYLSGLVFSLQASETAEDLETELEIMAVNQGGDPFHAVVITLLIPEFYLEVLPDLQAGESFTGGMWSMNVSGDTVTVALAGSGPVVDGKIAGIPLFALKEGVADLAILSVQVDEFTARDITSADASVVINTRPAVGIGPGEELPGTFVLHQNYPNPFNPGTMIRFDLPESGQISLRMYDTAGRLVATPADGFMEAGRHELYLDTSGMPLGSGVYFLVLQKGESRSLIKLSLIK
ncbi:MAG: T9SS C-terminal target domain-containing protein [Balneolaceae bacterium]|nr:MAG: T9SS C-terminal target domain-containing protein [Balneolaceae bacterium]